MMFDNIRTLIKPWRRGVVRVLITKNWLCWKLPLQPKSGRPAPAADGGMIMMRTTRTTRTAKSNTQASSHETPGQKIPLWHVWTVRSKSVWFYLFFFQMAGSCFRSVSCSFQGSCIIFVRSCAICKRITWHPAGILIFHWFVLLLTNLSF